MALFDAGLFFVLMGVAFIIFFLKVPYKEAFMFVSSAIFFTLGFVLFSNYDVAFISYSSVSDGVTVLTGNSTSYIIGDATDNFNDTSQYLATFLLIIGTVTGLVSFVMFTNTSPKKD